MARTNDVQGRKNSRVADHLSRGARQDIIHLINTPIVSTNTMEHPDETQPRPVDQTLEEETRPFPQEFLVYFNPTPPSRDGGFACPRPCRLGPTSVYSDQSQASHPARFGPAQSAEAPTRSSHVTTSIIYIRSRACHTSNFPPAIDPVSYRKMSTECRHCRCKRALSGPSSPDSPRSRPNADPRTSDSQPHISMGIESGDQRYDRIMLAMLVARFVLC